MGWGPGMVWDTHSLHQPFKSREVLFWSVSTQICLSVLPPHPCPQQGQGEAERRRSAGWGIHLALVFCLVC